MAPRPTKQVIDGETDKKKENTGGAKAEAGCLSVWNNKEYHGALLFYAPTMTSISHPDITAL